MKSKMKDQILPKYLNRLTKFLNEHGDRYFVGSKVKLFIKYLEIEKGFSICDTANFTNFQGWYRSCICMSGADPYHISFATPWVFLALSNIFYTFILYTL